MIKENHSTAEPLWTTTSGKRTFPISEHLQNTKYFPSRLTISYAHKKNLFLANTWYNGVISGFVYYTTWIYLYFNPKKLCVYSLQKVDVYIHLSSKKTSRSSTLPCATTNPSHMLHLLGRLLGGRRQEVRLWIACADRGRSWYYVAV